MQITRGVNDAAKKYSNVDILKHAQFCDRTIC